MDFLSAFWHLCNLFAPGVGVALIAALATKLLWRVELRRVGFLRLWGWASVATVAVSIAGLVIFGRDGKMATYAAMVVACALGLWVTGFVRRA